MRTADVERIRNALSGAESFIEGFEGDDAQEDGSVEDMLTDIAAAFGELSVLIDERDALKARVALLEARIPAAQP